MINLKLILSREAILQGVVFIGCARPGCNQVMGAQRYEGGKVVEEEFYPDVINYEGHYYCKSCLQDRDIFKDPLEDVDGLMEDVC